MKCYPGTSPMAIIDCCDWETDGPWHRWMKCYPGTSPIAITECCDMDTGVPWTSMNEVLPRDETYGLYWMMWLGDRSSMGIDEWSSTQGLDVWPLLNDVTWWQTYGLYWMMWLGNRSSMGIDEWSATKGRVLWLLLNIVTWIQIFHGHRWMKCDPGTSPLVITECCDLETDVSWASMNEVLP
jgi:hypothetical protein